MAKNTICLWYDGAAEEAAKFYAKTFPDSRVTAVHYAPGDYPDGKQGDPLTVEFTVLGIACVGLNGGPMFKHSEAFSFQVITEDQAETDRYWNAIVGNGGEEKMYVASADWMTRNLSRRIEVAFPIYEPEFRKIIRHEINLQLQDTVKARTPDNHYVPVPAGKEPLQSQLETYNFYRMAAEES